VGTGALFLWTPYVLLGRRLAWRRLVPTAALTAGAVLVFGIGAAIALPGILTHNTERYGLIGFAFSMVSCLFALAGIVIAAAALGSLIDEERQRAPIA
jgi:membrane protein